jgi:hypothetical protein
LTSAIVALALSKVILLYPRMGSGFVCMVFGSGITTPFYYYTLIPFLTLIPLIVVNFKELIAAFDYKGFFADYIGTKKETESNTLAD